MNYRKKSIRYCCFIVVACLLVSCNDKEQRSELYADVKKIESLVDLSITKIDMDTVEMDYSPTTSGSHVWQLVDNRIYMFDLFESKVYVYSLNGKFIKKAIGIGHGPEEVLDDIDYACSFSDKWFLTENYNTYVFNHNFKHKERKSLFDMDITKEFHNKVMKSKDPTIYPETYVPAYENPGMIQFDEVLVLMKICCEYPDNYSKLFYESSSIAGFYNVEEGKLEKIVGGYPPVYRQFEAVPAFSTFDFCFFRDQKNVLLSFALDSNIYICNKSFVPLKSFGCSGKMRNISYKNLLKNDQEYSYSEELNTKGYYLDIFYCNDLDVVLRTYRTGCKTDEVSDTRMQIYKGVDLIGDVEVPDNFEIFYYSKPFIWGSASTDTQAKVRCFKCKLPL